VYSLIAENRRRTVLLFLLMGVVITGLSVLLGYLAGDFFYSVLFAGVLLIVTTFMVFNSSRSVLKALHAAEPDLSNPKHKLLYNVVENLCLTTGMPMPKIYILPDSGYNAFATGLSEDKAIIGVTEGLLEVMDKSELEAVIGHELSHIKNQDIRISIFAFAVAMALLLIGELMLRTRGEKNPLPLIGLIILVVGYPVVLLTRLALSRQREYLADVSSVEMTRNPDAMARALEKLKGSPKSNVDPAVSHMMFNMENTGFLAKLLATHPPLDSRIERINQSFNRF
jgi:heat shock protein HtpX